MTREQLEKWVEEATHAELERFRKLSLEELVERVAQRRLGDFYQVWAAVTEKADLRTAAPLLMAELENAHDEMSRYHCALALLSALPYTGIRPWDLAQRSMPGHEIYMNDVREILARAVDTRIDE